MPRTEDKNSGWLPGPTTALVLSSFLHRPHHNFGHFSFPPHSLLVLSSLGQLPEAWNAAVTPVAAFLPMFLTWGQEQHEVRSQWIEELQTSATTTPASVAWELLHTGLEWQPETIPISAGP